MVGTLNFYSRAPGFFSKEDASIMKDLTRELGNCLQESPVYNDSEQRHIDALTDLPNARRALQTLRAEVGERSRTVGLGGVNDQCRCG